MAAGVGQGPHRRHAGQPPRLVHLPPAHLGRAYRPVCPQGERRAAPTNPGPDGAGGAAHGAARYRRLVRPGPRGTAGRGGDRLRQGDRYPRRVVRFRRHPRLRTAPARGAAGARRHVPGGLGPAPRLVPVLPADQHRQLWPGALQGGAHPRLHRGQRRPQDVKIHRQCDRTQCRDERPGRRHPAPVGSGHRLSRRVGGQR